MKSPTPTQKELAKVLGIAQSTVSMALRGHSAITAKTRDTVLRMAAEIGYEPNPTGAALAHLRQASRVTPVKASLAWINGWPEPAKLRAYREFDSYWRGAESEARQLGYRIDEFIVDSGRGMKRLEGILAARSVPGILLPPGPAPEGWRDLDWSRFSVVRLSRGSDPGFPGACSVAGDQSGNALLAFREMMRLGYRRIGFAGIEGRERMFLAGYLMGQQELPENQHCPVLWMSHDADPKAWDRSFDAWWHRNRPDAILTDVPRVSAALSRLGVKVPGEVGLATLGTLDSSIAAGIDQNSSEIGRAAVQILNSMIKREIRGFPEVRREVLVRGRWVDGDTLPRRG